LTEQDAINAANVLKDWCEKHHDIMDKCKCPFSNELDECFVIEAVPKYWFYEDEENGEV